ncbi:hypothetical protein CPCC7001_1528 [Cyanobium sp. PCC 7001]|nr:hypothetical protein CPCC7001_1528 [Cyanobium sp. PCC 7001]
MSTATSASAMTTTAPDQAARVLSQRDLLREEGCPWANTETHGLYLAINDWLADYGWAFGHIDPDTAKYEANFSRR